MDPKKDTREDLLKQVADTQANLDERNKKIKDLTAEKEFYRQYQLPPPGPVKDAKYWHTQEKEEFNENERIEDGEISRHGFLTNLDTIAKDGEQNDLLSKLMTKYQDRDDDEELAQLHTDMFFWLLCYFDRGNEERNALTHPTRSDDEFKTAFEETLNEAIKTSKFSKQQWKDFMTRALGGVDNLFSYCLYAFHHKEETARPNLANLSHE